MKTEDKFCDKCNTDKIHNLNFVRMTNVSGHPTQNQLVEFTAECLACHTKTNSHCSQKKWKQ
jgi:hypothetical protein